MYDLNVVACGGQWVCHELETARKHGIEIITMIDTVIMIHCTSAACIHRSLLLLQDKYIQRDLIEQYTKLGFSYLFAQVNVRHLQKSSVMSSIFHNDSKWWASVLNVRFLGIVFSD